MRIAKGENERSEMKRTLVATCKGTGNTGALDERVTASLCTESPDEFSTICLAAFAINKKSTLDRAMRKT
ncbi:MAG: hypothetical protein ACUVT7_01865 [Thermoplasmata archaeon]